MNLDNNFNMVEQPENLDINLYNHQLSAIYMMEKLEREKCILGRNTKITTNMGIYADITGYGKTLSVIGLILRDKMEWETHTLFKLEKISSFCRNYVKKFETEVYEKVNCNLILVNSSIIHQWLSEFSHTNLNVAVITTRKVAFNIDIKDYDAILVTPRMFNLLCSRHSTVCWKRFIYDEPSNIKVVSMARAMAGFTWFITATPSEIYFRHKTARNSYMFEILGNRSFEYDLREILTIKNDDNFVRNSYIMPVTQTLKHICSDKIFRAVNGLVNERVMRFIEAGHIGGAIESLGGKKTDNIIELIRKNKTIELEEIKSKMKIWSLRGDEEKFKEWEKREIALLNQINELDKRFSEILNSNCSICYDKINKAVMEPSCQNIFCGKCLLTWLETKGNCPLCRKNINKNELVYIQSPDEKEEKEIKKDIVRTKEETILDILNEKKDGKFIIFSDWFETFETITNLLHNNDISFIEIKGTAETRQKNIDKFKFGNIKVAFLNSNIDCSGINLTETTDIILYHKMSEETRQQIVGRANRIGRKNSLVVHHLISR